MHFGCCCCSSSVCVIVSLVGWKCVCEHQYERSEVANEVSTCIYGKQDICYFNNQSGIDLDIYCCFENENVNTTYTDEDNYYAVNSYTLPPNCSSGNEDIDSSYSRITSSSGSSISNSNSNLYQHDICLANVTDVLQGLKTGLSFYIDAEYFDSVYWSTIMRLNINTSKESTYNTDVTEKEAQQQCLETVKTNVCQNDTFWNQLCLPFVQELPPYSCEKWIYQNKWNAVNTSFSGTLMVWSGILTAIVFIAKLVTFCKQKKKVSSAASTGGVNAAQGDPAYVFLDD